MEGPAPPPPRRPAPDRPSPPSEPPPEPPPIVPFWRWRLQRIWSWMRRHPRLIAAIVALAGIAAIVVIRLLADEQGVEQDNELPATISAPARQVVGGLSPEEKVDQVLAVGFDDPKRMAADLRRMQLGGVVVPAEQWRSGGPGMLAELRAAGSGAKRIPPLIIARQEGGDYRSYPDLPPAERQLDIGDAASAESAESSSASAARALKEAGFDLNLAPLADVATLDSPVADRAYSDDAGLTAELTAAAVRGCRTAGLLCAVSHFPGLGAASQDTDQGPATISLDEQSLAARDLLPFEAAFEEKVPAVVLSHAFYAAYDSVVPGSLSPAVIDDLLRDQLRFQGAAITDDLSAGAIAAGEGPSGAAVSALAAGADLIVVSDPADAKAAREALLAAVRAGEIPADRLNQAAARVLELKQKAGLLPKAGAPAKKKQRDSKK